MLRMSRKRKKIVAAVIIAAILIIGGVFALGIFNKKETAQKANPEKKYYSQLTGEEVKQDIAERPILGVMIENSEEARPQTGLDSAGIVYEAVTEGGITRYLALYQEDMPEVVGPVRSLRIHFLDWVMGYDASIAHVGGSADALETAENRKAKSLSELKYGESYYRDNNREAPHNAYAKTNDLRELQKRLDHKNSSFSEIPRKNDAPSATVEAPKVTIDFSFPLFQAEFQYDKTTNSYNRFLAGAPHIDTATNKPINVKNVIVLKAVGKENGVETIGSGEALLFMDGKLQKLKWEKTGYDKRTRILNAQNNEVPLNRGSSWFAVVSQDRPVSF